MGLDEMIIQAGLYNQKSTDNDRKEKIENLLRKRNRYDGVDDEIPNNELLNEMLARNEVFFLSLYIYIYVFKKFFYYFIG